MTLKTQNSDVSSFLIPLRIGILPATSVWIVQRAQALMRVSDNSLRFFLTWFLWVGILSDSSSNYHFFGNYRTWNFFSSIEDSQIEARCFFFQIFRYWLQRILWILIDVYCIIAFVLWIFMDFWEKLLPNIFLLEKYHPFGKVCEVASWTWWHSYRVRAKNHILIHIIDGRNPAPPGMNKTLQTLW